MRMCGGAVRQGPKSCIFVHDGIVKGPRLLSVLERDTSSCAVRGREVNACLLLAGFGGETESPLLGSSGG